MCDHSIRFPDYFPFTHLPVYDKIWYVMFFLFVFLNLEQMQQCNRMVSHQRHLKFSRISRKS